jgi:hypothetical protein
MSKMITWEEFEGEYTKNFKEEKGAPAKSFRIVLGALIIKEMLGISDRETVEQIKENPYLQYFIGIESYSSEEPFEASTMVNFRKRIGMELTNKINKEMVKKVEGVEKKEENEGKLLLDATCTPADIKYPTDIGIL